MSGLQKTGHFVCRLLQSWLTMGEASWLPAWLEQCRLWLNRLMQERQTLPQRSRLCVLCSSVSPPCGVGSWYLSWFSTLSCGQLQGPPRRLHRCQASSCVSCRCPCIAAASSQWFFSLMPALHRGCLLGCGHRSWRREKTMSTIDLSSRKLHCYFGKTCWRVLPAKFHRRC